MLNKNQTGKKKTKVILWTLLLIIYINDFKHTLVIKINLNIIGLFLIITKYKMIE